MTSFGEEIIESARETLKMAQEKKLPIGTVFSEPMARASIPVTAKMVDLESTNLRKPKLSDG